MASGSLRFGPFQLDRENIELRRSRRPVKLDRISFELLSLLAGRAGQLITQQEAAEHVWGKDVFIEQETALYTAVRKIRRALGDRPVRPRYVETVARKGYRFIAPVTRVSAPTAKPASAALSTLAVLPLTNLTGDPKQEYFSDGLTEELITQLGRFSPTELAVIARTSVMRYKGSKKSVAEIARELRVDYLIEGSTRRERGRVRFTVQLIRASDEIQVWTESYDRSFSDILVMQMEFAKAVSEAIRHKLAPAMPTQGTVDPGMYDAYLRGCYLWDQRTPVAIRGAIHYFELALERDTKYAPAWAGLARCYSVLPITCDGRPREAFPRAAEAAARALQLDATLPAGHLASGIARFWFDWDWRAAEQEFRRTIELNPSDPSGHTYLAHLCSNLRRHDEALSEIRAALSLDRFSLMTNQFEGQFLYDARRYDEAIGPLKRTLELAPRFWIADLTLGRILGMQNRYRDALAQFARAYRESKGNTFPLALRGFTLARSGQIASARQVLRELERLARRRYVPPSHRGLVCLGLSDRSAALELLEEAVEERDVFLTFLAVEHRWDSLRESSGFRKICRKVGVPV
jgi:TolB-like protein/Flp pilus assembly protein TadD